VKGIIITLKPNEKDDLFDKFASYDFISRYFAPWNGINEDPVTGSAHTVLSVYWGKKLNLKIMKAYQASPRGGDLLCTLNSENDRVYIKGCAITVCSGSLCI